MKKIILVCMICVTILCGCSFAKVETADTVQENTSMFVLVEECYAWEIVYHKDTKVMYSVSNGRYNLGNFTVLVNADGSPMLYEGGAE